MKEEIKINRCVDEIEDDISDLIDEYIDTVFDGEIGEDGEQFYLTYSNGEKAYTVTVSIDEDFVGCSI